MFYFCCVCVSAVTRSQRSGPSEELRDEAFNRQASLLKCVSVVLCCSPVCEKQALFALFQSHKENNIEDPLIKKVRASLRCCVVLNAVPD